MDVASLVLKNLLSSLGLGYQGVVGVDIGSSSVKLCELSGSEKSYKLERFAVLPLPEASFFGDEVQKEDEIVDTIKKLFEEEKSQSATVCVGMWGPNVVAKRIQVGMGSIDEIGEQVEWEFEQYIPFDADDATISFHFLGENEGGGADVLVVAAKTELVQKFKEMVEAAGPAVKIIDCNQFAIANIFSYVHKEELENALDSLALIEFGANSTNIIIYRNSTIVFTRELSIGGQIITDEIQKAMGLSYEEAEELKVNGDQNGNIPEEIVGIVKSSLDVILSEIKTSLDFYMSSNEEKSFSGCYITGGSSRLPSLVNELKESLQMDVLFFNPFEKINVDDSKFDESYQSIISNIGVTSLGLAMRNLKND